MGQYAIYLRKSRADVEAEARGEGETLARHRTALYALAERRGLNVVKEYAEIVSGDSVRDRPQMMQLLRDVTDGKYNGVIVNDIDRLSRGDSMDQGYIINAFVQGHCLIITPTKEIDLSNPSDFDMLDMNLFFGRFELRKIVSRMKVGRTRSAQSGNFIASTPPYGYKRSPENHLKLVPKENESDVVRIIYDSYAYKDMSLNAITHALNSMGIRRPKGGEWDRASVKYVLRNPVYTGCIVWAKRVTVSTIENWVKQKKRVQSTPIIVENTHEPIVPKETFDIVQRKFENNIHSRPVSKGKSLTNPLAGILYCSECGKPMLNHGKRGRNDEEILLACLTPGCPTVSCYLSVIMEQLCEILRDWCATYAPTHEIQAKAPKPNNALIQKEEQILKQLKNAQEFVETGVYTPAEYLERKKELNDQLAAVRETIKTAPVPLEVAMPFVVPKISKVIEALNYTDDPAEQNKLLKSIIVRIDYSKTRRSANKEQSARLITLVVYPKISISM